MNDRPAMRGSIRGVRVIKVPKAFAALDRRTSLEGSAKDLAKVRCSCGKKGFRNVGIFPSMLFSVSRIAPSMQLAMLNVLDINPLLTFHLHGSFGNNSYQRACNLSDKRSEGIGTSAIDDV